MTFVQRSGAIAQLGERIVRNDEVVGSIPTSSTKFYLFQINNLQTQAKNCTQIVPILRLQRTRVRGSVPKIVLRTRKSRRAMELPNAVMLTCFRDTFAVELLNKGVPIDRVVQPARR